MSDPASHRVDWLVLTAANAAQARGYRAQLQARREQGLLGQFAADLVVPDPGGRRVGSGGSTLWVLFEVARRLHQRRPQARTFAELFNGQRLWIIHSGGDARRLAPYAAQGKVFTPLPCTAEGGQPATLFDLLIQQLAALPAPPGGHVLLASGDVLLTFDPQAVDFSRPGVTGVAYPGPLQRGAQHGVYVAGPDGRVMDFLQKPDEAAARRRGAVDGVGRVLIDTGLVSLDPPTADRWLAAAGARLRRGRAEVGPGLLADVRAGEVLNVDLYRELLMTLPPRLDRQRYLEETAPRGKARRRLARLHDALHAGPFFVSVLPYCDFFHIGTSRELLSNINTLSRTASQFGFANLDRSVVAQGASLEAAFIYNSLLGHEQTQVSGSALVEAVRTRQPLRLDGRNILVGLPAEADQPLHLPAGWGLVCLPVRGQQSAAVLFGLDDDFKTPWPGGGTFGNRPLASFMEQSGLSPMDLFPRGSDQTLWQARLWLEGPLPQVLEQTLWLMDPQPVPPRGWRARRRYSMAQLLGRVDHARLIAHRRQIQRLGALHHLSRRLRNEPWLPAKAVSDLIEQPEDAALALAQVAEVIRTGDDPLLHARLYKLAQVIEERHGPLPAPPPLPAAGKLETAAFDAVGRAVAQAVEVAQEPRPARIQQDQVVWVTCPVRLDLAGGWSDTPPICTELGGSVVNAAITLNGQYPVQVMAKLAEEPVIRLTSIDLGRRVTLRHSRQVLDHRDPSDWAALPKAALVLAGVCPRDPAAELKPWLEVLGGGLDLTLFSALPKGSGLGTSSVLGAALLACLARVVGEPLSSEQLIARTSVLEQLMTTMGGWQDQVGGITPGVKLIRTAPGPEQIPSLHWTSFTPPAPGNAATAGNGFQERVLLYYTGYQRLAKNILQNVVGRYLARDPRTIQVIHEVKALAPRMKTALDARDFDEVGRLLDSYWELKKRIDPGSTTPAIEALLRPLAKDLAGKVLPGAGGGGFVLMIARDEPAAQRIRQRLQHRPPNDRARFFDFEIDPQGLKVTVL